jgi:hypothetical protein
MLPLSNTKQATLLLAVNYKYLTKKKILIIEVNYSAVGRWREIWKADLGRFLLM